MNSVLQRVYEIGIIPVIAFNSVDEALPLCKALMAGGLPAAEVTFRTACAEDCIKKIHEELPEMLLGAEALARLQNARVALFGLGGLPLADALSRYYLWSYTGVFLIAAVGATPLPVKILRQLKESRTGSIIVSVLEPLVLLALLAAVTAYLVDGSFNPFLYFRF